VRHAVLRGVHRQEEFSRPGSFADALAASAPCPGRGRQRRCAGTHGNGPIRKVAAPSAFECRALIAAQRTHERPNAIDQPATDPVRWSATARASSQHLSVTPIPGKN
jgi:hypothetical protein